MEKVNDRVRRVREHLGLTQTEFANVVGMSLPGISAIENSNSEPRFSNLKKISNGTGVNYEWLKSGTGEMTFQEVSIPGNIDNKDWKGEAYTRMEEQLDHYRVEIQFLREMLINVTGKTSANFPNAFVGASVQRFLNIGESVRPAA